MSHQTSQHEEYNVPKLHYSWENALSDQSFVDRSKMVFKCSWCV